MQKTTIDIRLYRIHDPDLIMLASYGISIQSLLKKALLNYVNGINEKYYIPYSQYCIPQNKTSYHYQITLKDHRIAELMQNIKFRYRNAFCKALLRDMLLIEPLGIYFSQKTLVNFENDRIKKIVASDISPIVLTGKEKGKTKKVESHPIQQPHESFAETIADIAETSSKIDDQKETDATIINESSSDCIDFINRMEQLIGI